MSLDPSICPYLSLAMSGALLFPGRPEERYGHGALPVPYVRHTRPAPDAAPLPTAKVHRTTR